MLGKCPVPLEEALRSAGGALVDVALDRGASDAKTDSQTSQTEMGQTDAPVSSMFTRRKVRKYAVITTLVLIGTFLAYYALAAVWWILLSVIHGAKMAVGYNEWIATSSELSPYQVKNGGIDPILADLNRFWADASSSTACVAAPVVGHFKQVLMLGDDRVLVNPTIVATHGRKTPIFEQSLLCPSDPKHRINRYASVTTRYLAYPSGQQMEATFTGGDAYCIQHYAEVFAGRHHCHS